MSIYLLEIGFLLFLVGVLVHFYDQYEAHGLTHAKPRSLIPITVGSLIGGYAALMLHHFLIGILMELILMLVSIASFLKVRDWWQSHQPWKFFTRRSRWIE